VTVNEEIDADDVRIKIERVDDRFKLRRPIIIIRSSFRFLL